MLDKLLLNNQIITNKKRIQQARIQTINKLVQKIRKLKALNEKKPNNAKITQNLEKTANIMGCVKKIKTVDIIRKILILSKKPAAVLTNGRAPIEEIAVALLANNKILSSIVATLKTLLHLDDNNPGWKDEIMELSKRKKKLLQSGGRKKNPKVGKSENKPIVKKNPWKEENLETVDSERLKDHDDVAPSKGWTIEPVSIEIDELTASAKPKETLKKKPAKEDIRNKNVNDSIDEIIEPQKAKQPTKTVDSFFFTETGDNYLSTVVIDRIQPETPDDGLIRRERRDNTLRSYQRNINNRRQSVQNGRIDKRQSFGAAGSVKPKVADEKLHPSWAAKQKLKPTITQFKGQKIVFGDDGESNKTKSSGKNPHKSSYQDKSAEKVQSQDNLHPSWAAKQKLKPAITEFKGKKITFDD